MIRSVIDKNLWSTVSTGGVNSNTYDKALGFNMVRIKPNMSLWSVAADKKALEQINRLITGVMINEFTYSMESEWTNIETPFDSGLGDVVNGVGVAAGGGEMGAVYKSKLFWKKSGYLTMEPQIRILDIDGDGLPLRVARLLLQWTVANNIGPGGQLAKKGETYIRDIVTKAGSAVQEAFTKVAEDVNPTGTDGLPAKLPISAAGVLTNAISNLAEDASDLFALRQTPPPLEVEIGRVFKHKDMVLTNVSFTFSSEYTDHGPMFIDATLNLTTRKRISTIDDIGIYDGVDGNVNILAGDRMIDTNTKAKVANPLDDLNKDKKAPPKKHKIGGRRA